MDTLSLIESLRKGDEKAKEELVKQNEGLVWSIVRRYSGRGTELQDLYQIGMIGLLKAIDKFDLSLGLRFSTYAVPLINGEIRRFLRDDGLIKVSRIIKENARIVYQAGEQIEKKTGNPASLEELAEATGLTADDVATAIAATREVESLYKTVYDNDGKDVYLIDKTCRGEDFRQSVVDNMTLNELLEGLSGRDKFIIHKRYFENKTQSDVAKLLGVSQVQVSRLEKKILLNMRKELVM
ncbi:MAG: SigB/SigF/SigG family RNA polymerase sigma factor [Clostridiales bacterium]|nr:SigB/SigF/SigG family RNA polymerase sigma factor [Clostridiales bacterium]